MLLCAFLLPSMEHYRHTGDNYFRVTVNGIEVGSVEAPERIDALMAEARRQVALELGSDDLILMDLSLELEGSERLWGKVDSDRTIIENLVQVMKAGTRETLHRSYTVKINEMAVNLGSYEDVHALLKQAIEPYDTKGIYDVELALDSKREINVLEARVVTPEEIMPEEEPLALSAGIEADFDAMFTSVEPVEYD